MIKTLWEQKEVDKLEELKQTEPSFTKAVEVYSRYCKEHNWPDRSLHACRKKIATVERKITSSRRKWTTEDDEILIGLKRLKNADEVYDEFIRRKQGGNSKNCTLKAPDKQVVISKWTRIAVKRKKWSEGSLAILKTIMDCSENENVGIQTAMNMFHGDGYVVSKRVIKRKIALIKSREFEKKLYNLAGIPLGTKLTKESKIQLKAVLKELEAAGDSNDLNQIATQERFWKMLL